MKVIYNIHSLFKTRQQQHGGWKKEVTIKFYGKWCFPVITWYKQHSLKQVLPTRYTLDNFFFLQLLLLLKICELIHHKHIKKCKVYFCLWVFLAFLQKLRPYKYCLWEVDLLFYMKVFRLMCQSANLFWKISVYNAGCVFCLFLWRTQTLFLVKIAPLTSIRLNMFLHLGVNY